MSRLVMATLLAGPAQILLGVLRVGRLVQAIPVSVVSGFMAIRHHELATGATGGDTKAEREATAVDTGSL